jgi:undecaprenol kinase
VWASERSFRTQVVLAMVAGMVTAGLRPGWLWAALVALCCGLVLALELLNSALEYLIDHVHPSIAPAIKHAKDAAAAAVLMASGTAVVVGALMVLSVLGS